MSSKRINEEEFENFLYKVNEVNGIVRKLASNDKNLQKIGDLEAQKYLDCKNETSAIDAGNLNLKITSNRTVINKKALMKENKDNTTMSQELFMEEVSKDADKRYKDKQIRKERMETFKKQALNAFRGGNYEKALSLYNKAIEQIKDSPLLYQNRALTFINLKLYDKAVNDLDWALKLNENSLKSWFLLAKAYYLNEKILDCKETIKKAIDANTDKEKIILEFAEDLVQEKKTI